jgi:putative zinc finger/helix-turn-helix YgiT family protein
MQCEECRASLEKRIATDHRPYIYRASGLADVGLSGITVWICPKCSEESPEIPRIGELHRVIARALIQKQALLRGDEVRFLRKHVGIAAGEFATMLGVDRAHLSRVENGRTAAFGESTDRLVRGLALIAADEENGREALRALAHRLHRSRTRSRRVFTLRSNRWRPATKRAA